MSRKFFSFHAMAAARGEGLRAEFFGTRSGIAIGAYRPAAPANASGVKR